MPERAEPMTHWLDAAPRRGNVVTIPTIWLAFLLSLFVHIAALWEFLPRLRSLSGEAIESSKAGEPLAVRLATPSAAPPPPSPPPQSAQLAPARKAQVSPPPKARTEKVAPSAAPAPPVVAAARSAPESAPQPPVAPAVPPAPAAPPVEGDLASFIAARRRARGEPEPSVSSGSTSNAPPADSDLARRDRIVAANLASLNAPTFGGEPKNSGGIFQIRRLGYDDAEFTFFGWNKDINRRASQLIEVRRGTNPDIRIAVIRRMIAIIRQYEKEDFTWNSRRLGRVVVLSARPDDTTGLEEFMMQEFFSGQGP
jgi:hypothetical protein